MREVSGWGLRVSGLDSGLTKVPKANEQGEEGERTVVPSAQPCRGGRGALGARRSRNPRGPVNSEEAGHAGIPLKEGWPNWNGRWRWACCGAPASGDPVTTDVPESL